jgi:hypothetical protein
MDLEIQMPNEAESFLLVTTSEQNKY